MAGGPDDQALGDTINAEEAERIGLISELVAEDELDAAVDRLARRLATGPAQAQRQWSYPMLHCSCISSIMHAWLRQSRSGMFPMRPVMSWPPVPL